MKQRILFVDDNPLLLQMYAMMLDDERERWEVVTTEDARRGLEMMEEAPFDVVLCEMKLYGMHGIQFMNKIKQRFPRCSRILLSGYSDQEEFAHSLDATHQFLAKPFDVKALKSTLARIGGLDTFLKDPKLQSLAGRLSALPSFPSLYVEIMKELNADEPSIDNITAIISKDPGMTAKMLQVVNSAVVGLARKVGSPFEAVQFLGMGTVRTLAVSVPIFSSFEGGALKGLALDRLWDHAIRCAQMARAIMRHEKAEAADVEDAYTAAMLHDIGKLMLADSLPDLFQQALTIASDEKIPLHEAELRVLGATHAGVAAYLLGLWGLPAAIVETVAFHHTPGLSDIRAFGPLAAVHAANAIDHELSGAHQPGPAAGLDAAYLAAAGVQDRLEGWRVEAAKTLVPAESD
jgi:putative nucleotidyltransferase with HDIG domain